MSSRSASPHRLAAAGAIAVAVLVAAGCGSARETTPVPSAGPTAAATAAQAATPTAAPAGAPTASPTPTAPPESAPAVAPTAAASAGGDLAAELVRPGFLVTCMDFPATLMAEVDEQGNQIGVNVDIGRELARSLGVEADVRDVVFESLIDAVAGGECDISVSGQIITAARLERIAMIPYLQSVQHVVVRAGNPTNIQSLLDLCGKRLAVQRGTTHIDLVLGGEGLAGPSVNEECAGAGRPEVILLQFAEADEAVDALASDAADAYIGNDFVILERSGEFELSADLPPTRLGIGVAHDKPALEAAVRGALDAMVADGSYLGILETYDVVHLARTE